MRKGTSSERSSSRIFWLISILLLAAERYLSRRFDSWWIGNVPSLFWLSAWALTKSSGVYHPKQSTTETNQRPLYPQPSMVKQYFNLILHCYFWKFDSKIRPIAISYRQLPMNLLALLRMAQAQTWLCQSLLQRPKPRSCTSSSPF